MNFWERVEFELDKKGINKKTLATEAKFSMSNISKGKNMKDGYLRCNYDLSILMSKYDSYLKWKSKQNTFVEDEKKNIENVTTTKVLYSNIQQQTKKEDDIADILDELI